VFSSFFSCFLFLLFPSHPQSPTHYPDHSFLPPLYPQYLPHAHYLIFLLLSSVPSSQWPSQHLNYIFTPLRLPLFTHLSNFLTILSLIFLLSIIFLVSETKFCSHFQKTSIKNVVPNVTENIFLRC
jgi:hypothetical protein